MKFSIRTLLKITAVIALVALSFTKIAQLQSAKLRLKMAKVETQSLTVELAKLKVAHKEAVSMDSAREAAVAQFEVLLKKYTTLEPRDPGTFSIRSVPQLISLSSEPEPRVFRLRIPEDRPVWLKWGMVHGGSLTAYKESQLVEDSAMEHPGPYAIQLPHGDHILKFTRGYNSRARAQGQLPFKLVINDQVLIDTVYRSIELIGGTASIAARAQVDYNADGDLSGLINAKIKDLDPDGDTELAVNVWFDDKGGEEFQPFPGTE